MFDVDDSVAVLLDTYHDRRSCYAFAVNMAATRLDLRVAESGRSQDLGWDAVWDAAAARSEDGWTVEMAIPFSAMRFVPGESVTWGVEFLRHSTPSREESRWVHYEGDVLDPQQFADLTGLSCSDASRDLEVTVAAVGRYDVEDYRDYPLEPDWTVERVRIDWLLSRDSFVRLITQGAQIRIGLDDGDLRTEQYDLSLLYGWEFRPGSMFYLAYNQILDGGDGDGQFRDPVVVAKVSYLFTM